MGKSKTRAPEQTFAEVAYLRQLVESQVPVSIRLASNEVLQGQVEFFDDTFLRLTRTGQPNLFVFKHDIKYLYETGEK
jgi:host factor-I protein